ncbi:hypothetical protein MKX03_025351 [Papaver bracteatum]|nr:hypothetical protein MKX03_025351 [Papaver bracteatum]
METMESCVPPGFRFHPTDEELVGYYLKKKIACQKIDLDVIRDIDLYRIEPWDLIDRCRIGYEEQSEWYFFSHKDKKYPTGTRTNRATMAGFWKATGRDKAVYEKMRLIGMRKTLVFYKGRAPNGQKTDWIMHEYRLESDENGPPQEEGWVVCRAFKKRTTTTNQMKTSEGWESSSSNYFYDETSGVSSIVEPSVDYMSRNRRQQNFMCKQETATEVDNLNFLNSDPFVQLPQLESPSLPLIKRPSFMSLVSETSDDYNPLHHQEQQQQHHQQQQQQQHQLSAILGFNNNDMMNMEQVARLGYNGSSNNMMDMEQNITSSDWRALDKFVASQLMSQEDGFDHNVEGLSNFIVDHQQQQQYHVSNNNNSDNMMSLLLMQSGAGKEEVMNHSKLKNGFLSSTSSVLHGDNMGFCIFEK